jgi:hypothetical protein
MRDGRSRPRQASQPFECRTFGAQIECMLIPASSLPALLAT